MKHLSKKEPHIKKFHRIYPQQSRERTVLIQKYILNVLRSRWMLKNNKSF